MRSSRLLENVTNGVDRIAPYQPGKSIEQAAGGRDPAEFVKLASNENPLGCSPEALKALRLAEPNQVGRYPDADGHALKSELARRLGTTSDCIILGNGSNDILEMAAQLFLREDTSCVYSKHAFLVYGLATLGRGANPKVVPDINHSHDLTAMAEACGDPDVQLVFVANPNNPTGSWHPPEALLDFIRSVPPEVLVVLDEAYHEYVNTGPGESIAWTGEFENLLVTRSFSKIHGLASLRLGYGIANPELIDLMNRIRQPFNVNGFAQTAAFGALRDESFVALSRKVNSDGLEQITGALGRLGIQHFPTRGNFVMTRFDDAVGTYTGLLEQGVITRPLSNYGLKSHLRITAGTAQENDKLIATLESLV